MVYKGRMLFQPVYSISGEKLFAVFYHLFNQKITCSKDILSTL